MLISKKDLLAETGISYGQLYRWKRERLIPEEWFMKQASFTGQETFFPKEQMLNRIRAIQELKDKYSLEELAKLLSPVVSESGFTKDNLKSIEEISQDLISTFQIILEKDSISYMELLLFVILSELKEEFQLDILQVEKLLEGMKPYLIEMKSTGYIIAIIINDSEYFGVIYQENTQVFLDVRFHIIKKIRIDDVSNKLKIKYRENFNFQSIDSNQNQSNKPNDNQGNQSDESTEKQQKKARNSEENDQDNQDFILKFNNWEVRL